MNQFEQDVINRATVKLAGIGQALARNIVPTSKAMLLSGLLGTGLGAGLGAGAGLAYGAYKGNPLLDSMGRGALAGGIVGGSTGIGAASGFGLGATIDGQLGLAALRKGDKEIIDKYFQGHPYARSGIVGGGLGGLVGGMYIAPRNENTINTMENNNESI